MENPTSHKSGFLAYPPRWHAGIALTGAGIAGVIFVWSFLDGEGVGMVIGAILSPIGLYAALDAMTTRLWISGNHFHFKDRIFRVRTFSFDEIKSISFVPDELFFISLTDGRGIRFPAGAKNLPQLSDLLSSSASTVA